MQRAADCTTSAQRIVAFFLRHRQSSDDRYGTNERRRFQSNVYRTAMCQQPEVVQLYENLCSFNGASL